MKLPAHPRALMLLAAILPVMGRRARRSAAWVLVAALSSLFWLGIALLVFLALSLR